MASDVGICNRALQLLGVSPITSLSDTDSKAARACNTCYEPIRDRLLQSRRWKFAIKRATLAAVSPAPTWGRANAFPVPADFITMAPRYPEDVTLDIDFELENGYIMTDETSPLYIRYVAKITDANVMSPLFRELLSHEMAYDMCEMLTQSSSKKKVLENALIRIEGEARRANTFEGVAQISPDSEWVSRRT